MPITKAEKYRRKGEKIRWLKSRGLCANNHGNIPVYGDSIYCKFCLSTQRDYDSRHKKERTVTRKIYEKKLVDDNKCLQCRIELHPEMDKGCKTCLNCRERKSK